MSSEQSHSERLIQTTFEASSHLESSEILAQKSWHMQDFSCQGFLHAGERVPFLVIVFFCLES